MQQNLQLLGVNFLTITNIFIFRGNCSVISEVLKEDHLFSRGISARQTSKPFTGHTVKTESGSIAEVSHLGYFYRSAKYDMSNKNDSIFPAMPPDLK